MPDLFASRHAAVEDWQITVRGASDDGPHWSTAGRIARWEHQVFDGVVPLDV